MKLLDHLAGKTRAVVGAVVLALSVLLVLQVVRIGALDRKGLPRHSIPSRGEVLSNVRIHRIDSGGVTSDTSRLRHLLRDDCSVLVFYASSCPHCTILARRMAGVVDVNVPTGSVPVHWLSVAPFDTGAARFVAEHALRAPSFRLARNYDYRSLGISGWPTLYLAKGKVFLRELPRSLDSVTSLTQRECMQT